MARLFLDDIRSVRDIYRNDSESDWIVVRSYEEAIEYMKKHGCPSFIAFDHDLGDATFEWKSGLDVAKWIIEKDLDMNGKFIPEDFFFEVHSYNPVGKQNILNLLDSYMINKETSSDS